MASGSVVSASNAALVQYIRNLNFRQPPPSEIELLIARTPPMKMVYPANAGKHINVVV